MVDLNKQYYFKFLKDISHKFYFVYSWTLSPVSLKKFHLTL